jgi:hypothetical protein
MLSLLASYSSSDDCEMLLLLAPEAAAALVLSEGEATENDRMSAVRRAAVVVREEVRAAAVTAARIRTVIVAVLGGDDGSDLSGKMSCVLKSSCRLKKRAVKIYVVRGLELYSVNSSISVLLLPLKKSNFEQKLLKRSSDPSSLD